MPDHSSPVNGALLVLKPNASLYEEGIGALRRLLKGAPFNLTHGWDRIGRPSEAVPRDDHVWLRRRGHSRVVDNDDWGFVGNDKDPGLLF